MTAALALLSPAGRARAGIETVYQDLALFDNLSPADNFFAGRELAARLAAGGLRRPRGDDERRGTARRLQVGLPDSTRSWG